MSNELIAVIADSVIALGTLAAVFVRGGQVLAELKQARWEITRLRDWKHQEVPAALKAHEVSLAVHDERLDEHDARLEYLHQRLFTK